MLTPADRIEPHGRRLPAWLGGELGYARLFLLLFPVALSIYSLTSRFPGYVHQDTARVVMLGRLGFHNVDNVHPPLLPWMMHALDLVMPLNFVTLGILGAINAGVGAWAVWRIAVMAGGAERATTAMLLYCLIPFATFEAVKVNHNTILVALWPLTTWAFLLVLQSPTWRRGVLLGLLAGMAMLAKYYSALLLLALGLAALASRHRVRFFTSPGPYVAAFTGLVVLSPHLSWLIAQPHASTVQHAIYGANDPGTLPSYFVRRLALTYLPLVAGFVLLRVLLGPVRDGDADADQRDIVRSLLMIALVPMTLTVGLIVWFGLRASPTWVQPVFLVLPAALAAMLARPTPSQIVRMHQLGRLGLLLAAVAGPIVLWTGFRLGIPSAVEPHHEVAHRADAVWHAALNRPLRIVGGDHLASETAALVLPDRPRAWSRFTGEPWIKPEMVKQEGVLLLCGADYPPCRSIAEQLSAAHGGFQCDIKASRELWGRKGPVSTTTIFVIPGPGETIDRAAASKACG